MSLSTKLPVISLDRRTGKSALRDIDDLQPEAPEYLDYQGCVLIALRGRLHDRRREVPAAIWPELAGFLADSPGLMTAVYPSRRYAGREAVTLALALMAWHATALLAGPADPWWILIAEGLLNALMVQPQTVVGDELLEFVDDVLEEFGGGAAD